MDVVEAGEAAVDEGGERRLSPRAQVVALALLSSLLIVVMVLIQLQESSMGWLSLIQPGAAGAAAEIVSQDFPDVELQRGIGHDGQYFYVMARSPTDLDTLEENLGRTRYRLQRPLFPALAWILHPTGGGYGLVAAMILVGAASLVFLGVVAGLLSLRLGGPSLVAAVVPAIPGSMWTFRLGLADSLALGLALTTLLALHARRTRLAVVTAVAAVLAKEAMLVIIAARALAARDRASALAAGVAATVAGVWWFTLRLLIDTTSPQVKEFGPPLVGVWDNINMWLDGQHLQAAGTVVAAVLLLLFCAIRRRGHPLLLPFAAWMAMSAFVDQQVLALDHNGSRTMAPAVILGLITAVTPVAANVARARRDVFGIGQRP